LCRNVVASVGNVVESGGNHDVVSSGRHTVGVVVVGYGGTFVADGSGTTIGMALEQWLVTELAWYQFGPRLLSLGDKN